jgi:RecJ-like exonuclease
MNERRLKEISLFISLIGVIILMFVSENMEVNKILIQDVDESFLDKEVRVVGDVSNTLDKESFTLFDLTDETGKIKVIAYEDIYPEGRKVEILGKVTEYNGALEIEAKIISVIDENN